MYAIDDLSDAVDVTEELLTPVDARFWLKLVVVAFFVSGFGISVPSIPTSDGFSVQIDPAAEDALREAGIEIPTESLLSLLSIVIVVGIAFWLALTAIRAAMEFVLVASLVTGDVRIRRSIRRYAGRALSLFVFVVVAATLIFAPVAVGAYRAFEAAGSIEAISLSAVVGLAAAGAVSGVVYTVVVRLTTALVVPIMYAADVGVLAGWRRLAGRIRADPGEYVVYLVIATIVGFVASIFVTTIAAIAMIVVAIPFVLLAGVSLLLGPLAIPALLGLVLLFVLASFLVVGAINLPVLVYLRYYALLVLGDTDERYDLVPDRRRRVRAGDAWSGNSNRGDDHGDAWDSGAESGPETDADALRGDADRTDPSDGHGWCVEPDLGDEPNSNDADRNNRSVGHGWDVSGPSNARSGGAPADGDTTEGDDTPVDDDPTEGGDTTGDDDTHGDGDPTGTDERSDSGGWSYRDDDR